MNYADLPEKTKERLRDKVRYIHVENDEWWDAVYEDFIRVSEMLGIEVGYDHRNKRPCIYFTGFYMQGSHAAYEGEYSYVENAVEEITAYASRDEELHRIARELTVAQVACKLQCAQTITTHIGDNMSLDSSIADDGGFGDWYGSWYAPLEKQIEEALKDLAHWLFKQLEAEHEHLTSDEHLDEWLSDTDNLSSIYDESEDEAFA